MEFLLTLGLLTCMFLYIRNNISKKDVDKLSSLTNDVKETVKRHLD